MIAVRDDDIARLIAQHYKRWVLWLNGRFLVCDSQAETEEQCEKFDNIVAYDETGRCRRHKARG